MVSGPVAQYTGQVTRGKGCGVCSKTVVNYPTYCPQGNCADPFTCDSMTPMDNLYMKNCGSYNVYYLISPPRCQFVYCMG